ncbi:MAG: hypothetical protein CL691_03980 [Cellvibrionales bacterium]|nr:hypothetical protein [Cellvibrionales bacterium]|tara:strand:- start:40581 stop:41090 length:510 start_codon:yes stop_codon:yes gene_type:complete
MKKIVIFVLATVVCVAAVNYFSLGMPANSATNVDHRNAGIETWVYYEYFLNPNSVVVDLRNVESDKSTADVFRVLFQIAEEFEERKFNKVYLATKGVKKFYIEGNYFKELGSSFSYQNPVYLLRNFPENAYLLDGSKAYSTWTGGVIGVVGRQMEDLNDLSRTWFIGDF